MKNIMSEMMKNFGSFANLDFAKNIGSFEAFDAKKISRQVFDFQKSVFNNTFDTMLKLQEQSSSMTASLMGENKFLPEEGRKTLEEWRLSLRNNQFEFKKTLDDSYSQFMSFLAPEASEPEAKPAKSSEPESKAAKSPESELKTASKAAK